ncbi:UDP-glucose 4-epimerase GalE [Aidingimonas lacisalsi]|uniref:UDP-glucose 4-epimerase GalE n=1 Tax=Aidingimonas lacisalsi TaxID=2604086 RepID=UPI0011D189E7|nr:UDP-glucose 4-epimerase GalE [Aidingimonas lacisalsi]
MFVLVTGGSGYIGSHMVFSLLEAGHDIIVLDNLCNSSELSINRVREITGKKILFVQGDVRDRKVLNKLFSDYDVSDVLHFAGLKSVGESCCHPLMYYESNVAGTVVLCQAMAAAGVFNLVFSSSATVYGDGHPMPLHETLPTGSPTNPYGRSKLMIEMLLEDLTDSVHPWSIALLRYFNPIGAHESGVIGEDPLGVPNNLLPYLGQVAMGRRECVSIFGNDYPTLDGTGVRDYIHVMDLVEGHLCAMQAIHKSSGLRVWNLGTGRGYSVLEVIHTYEKISGCNIAYRMAPRRPGDVAACWADPGLAAKELGWKAKRGLNDMVRDAWYWQKKNPYGYQIS